MSELLTVSRQRAFLRCQRYHAFRYDERFEALSSDSRAAGFGTLTHHGLEAWYLAHQRGDADPLACALDAIHAAVLEADDPNLFDHAKAVALLTGYDARWGNAPLEVVAVEAEFRGPLVNPTTGAASRLFEIGGKIDVLVRDLEDGFIYVMEHKTTSLDITPGSVYWARLQLDSQVSTYHDGAELLGYPVAGCIYDVLQRPGQLPLQATPEDKRRYTKGKPCKVCKGVGRVALEKKFDPKPCEACEATGWKEAPRLDARQRLEDETVDAYRERIAEAIAAAPERYYQRGKVVRFDTELEDARLDSWSTAKQIRAAQRSGRHVRNPQACAAYNSLCAFFPVCTGQASIDDETLYRRRETAHPELSSGIQETTNASTAAEHPAAE